MIFPSIHQGTQKWRASIFTIDENNIVQTISGISGVINDDIAD